MSTDDENATNSMYNDNKSWFKKKSGELAFMLGIAGVSSFFGFGFTLTLAKKSDPTMFSKGLVGEKGMTETGSSVAMRALGRGTLYAVGGVGVLCFSVWKLMGVNNMEEFTKKMQSVMPRLPKNENPGRSDFKTVRELVEHLIEEDKKAKEEKKS